MNTLSKTKIFNLGFFQNEGGNRAQALRRLGIMMALAAVYFVADKLGLLLAFASADVTVTWPATGIAFAIIFWYGFDLWPGVFIGTFFANLTGGGNILASLGVASGSTLGVVLAAYLANKYAHGRSAFENGGDVFRFALAGLVGATAVASVCVSALALGSSVIVGGFGWVWLVWFLENTAGILIFAPFLVLLAEGGRYRWRKEDDAAAGMFLLYILAATVLLFEHLLPSLFNVYPFASLIALMVPPLIWAALRFGRRITAAANVFFFVVAVGSTLNNPYLAPGSIGNALLFLRFFVGVVSITNLIFAVTIYRQRKGERALAENERHFRSLVENSLDGILLTDAAGIVQYVSPAVRHITGYVPEDWVGESEREFIFPGDRKKYDLFSKDIVRHPRAAAALEIRLTQKDGGVRWVEFAAVNLLDDPAVEAIVIDFRDITERKEIAAAKNNFISSVSYRLCPPLAQAETYIAALRERKKEFTPLEQKYLAELYDANQKMIRLTSDIIRLTRIELGTIRTAPKVIDFRKMVEDALQGLIGKTQAKGIQIVWKHPPARTFITADPNLLGLAIQRLVSKLITLTSEKRKLHATLSRDDGRVVLQFFSPSVRDLRKKLQINSVEDLGSEEEKKEEELAFGFYMVQSLIELMEGKVYFEPSADGGEMISIVFPKSPVAGTEEAPLTAEKAAPEKED